MEDGQKPVVLLQLLIERGTKTLRGGAGENGEWRIQYIRKKTNKQQKKTLDNRTQ